MTQRSLEEVANAGPLIGIILAGLGVGLLVSALTSSFDGRFIFGFIAGMLISLGAYLTLPRKIREDKP